MDLSEFNLNLLTFFDAIYRHRSVSAAAQELDLTQPAVTAALNKLRAHFDNPLFVRTSNGMHPTPWADALAPKIARVLDSVRRLDEPTPFQPQSAKDQFKIYVNDIGMMLALPKIVQLLNQDAPHTQLTVIDLRQDEVVNALDVGEIDLAIGYFVGVPNWARQQHLRDTSYVCAMRKDHPSIGDTMTLTQYLNARHAMYWTHGSTYGRLDEALAKRGFSRDIAVRIPRLGAIPFLAAFSDFVVTIPEDLGLLFRDLIPIKLVPVPISLPSFQVKQYWHERLHADSAHKWLRTLILQIMKQLDLGCGFQRSRTVISG
ncbi:LysR family transcriptional regulator [Verminephrobacter eiseniae]|uniref:LysR family transcriptional regulator n=1 Tax=Verminephrobacter eiseniae TaxID=364317 RepID=UPI0010F2FAA1|nr:LysR family transcriptional regulator [Verminephrobacter eiseniae]KAB7585090.1 LysR family transcriptional regulator [Verminephrobacter sp. Larva24]MCW5230205.1 LysR family transcriptional regulator [Verminephrobacter eiseniae]MCW5291938.1 LysR family transcriptional regulator [Verminephrobacter eiseniae]MCW8184909.1 LysR family transcriptional regulator [Verminephrobacter eiseniae]MCW8223663.1 LysR family transcriptional regulator [Verminephrobacter eiseniae]